MYHIVVLLPLSGLLSGVGMVFTSYLVCPLDKEPLQSPCPGCWLDRRMWNGGVFSWLELVSEFRVTKWWNRDGTRWESCQFLQTSSLVKSCTVFCKFLELSNLLAYFSKCPVGFDKLYAFSCLQLLLSETYQVSIMLLNLDHLPFLGSHTS